MNKKMKTETYNCKLEDKTVLKELARKLGLNRQVEKADKPFPVNPMTGIEYFTYATLCPKRTKIEEFDSELIPLDCLQAYEQALNSDCFSKFEVWTIDEMKIDDPLIVGWTKEKYDWERKVCLIARWGNELMPFPVMLADAKKYVQGIFDQKVEEMNIRLAKWRQFLSSDNISVAPSKEGTDSCRQLENYHLNHWIPELRES